MMTPKPPNIPLKFPHYKLITEQSRMHESLLRKNRIHHNHVFDRKRLNVRPLIAWHQQWLKEINMQSNSMNVNDNLTENKEQLYPCCCRDHHKQDYVEMWVTPPLDSASEAREDQLIKCVVTIKACQNNEVIGLNSSRKSTARWEGQMFEQACASTFTRVGRVSRVGRDLFSDTLFKWTVVNDRKR